MNKIEKTMDGIGRGMTVIIMFFVVVGVYEFHSEFIAGILSVFVACILGFLVFTSPE